jgi:hypothetical protein
VTANNEYRFLRKLYKDIVLGYSYIASENIYIKHPSELDLGAIEDFYIQYLNEAKIKGLPDEKEKIKELCAAEIWSEEKEKSILFNKKEIFNLNETLKKIFIKSQITSINNQINNIQKELDILLLEKEELLALTAEKYANKKSNEMIIYKSIFKDEDLNIFLFSEDSFEELEAKELSKYIIIYNTIINNFSSKNVKKIAALPFFLNAMFLSEDNVHDFYGKPIIKLSNFQQELFSTGRMYKSVILKGINPREEYYEDLDELVNWYELNKNIKDASEVKYKNKNSDGSTYIGASKQEIKTISKVSENDEVIDLNKENKELSMQDIIKLQGL